MATGSARRKSAGWYFGLRFVERYQRRRSRTHRAETHVPRAPERDAGTPRRIHLEAKINIRNNSSELLFTYAEQLS